ncbi:MAG: DUF58 domain-containing protein [Flavobacteriia bacterium]|nr:DUF58 domain-containing protein [Flavobacteriia bacterium]
MKKIGLFNYSIHPKTFWFIGGLLVLYIISFYVDAVFYIAVGLTLTFFLLFLWDSLRLFAKGSVDVERSMTKVLSLGDSNRIVLKVHNRMQRPIQFRIIDELPFQLQERDFGIVGSIPGNEVFVADYHITPKERGNYDFGNTHVFVRSPWGLAERRWTSNTSFVVRVYPSIIQMKKYQLMSIEKLQRFHGVVKTRRVGHNYEFDQIKNYVEGDDYRSINWKATSRANELMVNQYTDEQAQPVYCLIDKSRQMNLPFNGMTLLDYAINASLVISNVTLQKKDRIGLVSFGQTIDSMMKASTNPRQLSNILEALYAEKPNEYDANYPLLYKVMNSLATNRSLLFLFTNIESKHHMNRILPQLLRLHKRHLLVVIFFRNDEMEEYAGEQAVDTLDIYKRTAAGKMVTDKQVLISSLRQHGIHCMLSRPSELTIDTLNKYLELKSRGMI